MKSEKIDQNKAEDIRELESHHFGKDEYPEIPEEDFLIKNEVAFDKVKMMLSNKVAKMVIDTDSLGLSRALVFIEKEEEGKPKKEFIFSTNLSHEIEELADVAYSGAR